MISEEEARTLYSSTDSAHDFDHVLRVTRTAEQLAREEGGDLEIVRAAALLHDISRAEEDRSGEGDHAELAAQKARGILIGRGVARERADAVANAIRTHRFRSSVLPLTLEAKVIFDADKLDSLGAIGVARAYAIAGTLNQRLYSEPGENGLATRDQHSDANHTPVVEFVVKLRHISGRMHTAAAKKIAQERHEYMSQFFERLGKEMRGEL